MIVIYVVIGALLAILCALNIIFGPKNHSSKVRTDDIEYIVYDYYVTKYTIDSEEDIKAFKKLVKKSFYFKAPRDDYLWDAGPDIIVYYTDGSKIKFGPHTIKVDGKIVQTYLNTFDFDAIRLLAGVE